MRNRTSELAVKDCAREIAYARRLRDEAIAAAEKKFQSACDIANSARERKIRMAEVPILPPLQSLLLSHATQMFDKEPGPYYPIKAILTQSEGENRAQVEPRHEAHLAHVDLVAALQNVAALLTEHTASPLIRPGPRIAVELPAPSKDSHQIFTADIYHDMPDSQGAPVEVTALRAFCDFRENGAFFSLMVYAQRNAPTPCTNS